MKSLSAFMAVVCMTLFSQAAFAAKPVMGVAEFKNEARGVYWWGGGVGWELSAKHGCANALLDEHRDSIKTIIDEESVVHLDDLVFRRTTLWENACYWADHPEPLLSLFDWDAETRVRESLRLAQAVSSYSM